MGDVTRYIPLITHMVLGVIITAAMTFLAATNHLDSATAVTAILAATGITGGSGLAMMSALNGPGKPNETHKTGGGDA